MKPEEKVSEQIDQRPRDGSFGPAAETLSANPNVRTCLQNLREVTDRFYELDPYSYTWMSYGKWLEQWQWIGDLNDSGVPMEASTSAVLAVQMRVIWTEFLQRVHLAATAGLLRHRDWIGGVCLSIQADNVLSFAANFRSLIESSGHLYWCLEGQPSLLAENYAGIRAALRDRGHLPPESLEDSEARLINFQFATPYRGKKEGPWTSKAARPIVEYVGAIQGAPKGPILDLYRYLCRIVHPNKQSLDFYVMSPRDDALSVIVPSDLNRAMFIAESCKRWKRAILDLVVKPFNLCLVSLKILNRLPVEELHTPFVDSIRMTPHSDWNREWKRLKSVMDAQES